MINSNKGDDCEISDLEETHKVLAGSVSPLMVDRSYDLKRLYKQNLDLDGYKKPQLDQQISTIDGQIMIFIKKLNISKLKLKT